MKSCQYIRFFSEISKEDTEVAGGKGANLGEMARAGFPVPPGFVVAAAAYRHFLKENNLTARINNILKKLTIADNRRREKASQEIRRLILTSPLPASLAREIVENYLALGRGQEASGQFRRLAGGLLTPQPLVAIRSSATSEDSKAASFAGQNETFLNIKGEANVVDAVRRCWASLFVPRSIFYRQEQKIDQFKAAIAVVVQLMIPAEVSGIIFSLDPVTNNQERIVIEAAWGLGEYIVQGKITPDHYEVNKSDLVIVERHVSPQKVMLVRSSAGQNKEVKVPESKVLAPKLSEKEVVSLARLGRDLEKHYYFPQDSEFAVRRGQIYVVQTRPVTTTMQNAKCKMQNLTKEENRRLGRLKEVLSGAPASPGIKSGPARVLHSAKEIGRVEAGDVLTAEQTNPDYVPAMKKAAAIVTDKGGRTSHAAIVSRELGIPCVVGTEKATKVLKDRQVITVDGGKGKVYEGAFTRDQGSVARGQITADRQELKTATKVYVNLAEPDKAKEVAAKNCDGVGLLRAEFMLAGIGIHPKKALEERKQKVFTSALAEQILIFAQAFYPRPVVYRATDFKTNEYRSLKGGEKYEPAEENPMIGFRGAYRYLIQPEVLAMEIAAIKIVREKEDFKNLYLMIPFCHTVEELAKVKHLLARFGLHRSPTFKLWLMAEIPANVILLEKFLAEGVDGVSIGSNDLTMLTLGVDRDNEQVAAVYDERNEAVLWLLEKIITTCRKMNITCSICGQAPSDYPDLTEKLVKWGITSVSVNPDAINRTREIIYQAERKLII